MNCEYERRYEQRGVCSVGINRFVILSEAKDLCIFTASTKSTGFACKLPRRVGTDLSFAHNLPWCMRS
jgi:hypothetical protein